MPRNLIGFGLILLAASAAIADEALKVGDMAPDFEVVAGEEKKLRLSDYRGKKNVILLFSRAHW